MDVVQQRFQEVNDEIAAVVAEYGLTVMPFVCECADPGCRGLGKVNVATFANARTHPTWYLVGEAHGVRALVVDGATGETMTTVPLD